MLYPQLSVGEIDRSHSVVIKGARKESERIEGCHKLLLTAVLEVTRPWQTYKGDLHTSWVTAGQFNIGDCTARMLSSGG